MSDTYKIIIIVFLICILYVKNNSDGMTELEKSEKSDIVMHNQELFTQPYELIKNKYSWIDPVIYEDLRHLAHNNQLNKQNVYNIL